MTVINIHTAVLFDPKLKEFVHDMSIEVNTITGTIAKVYKRENTLPEVIQKPDIDLRNKIVCPGFVDAHTHIFLHSYE